ncbi:MAG: hypothetical protein A2X34_01950 [Elusimicrobia bacterium GWC2_51_8]|nr:MAG: hypothetical protein A2X34_01950 [Elusimicrobia bacterium GWC2_51_8]
MMKGGGEKPERAERGLGSSVIFSRFQPLSAAVFFLFCACGSVRPGASVQSRDLAVVFQTRRYALSKTPDPELETALPGIVSASHDYAFKRTAAPADAGFSYTLAPKGAVYPFSEMEVSCVIRDKYASRYGGELCSSFFSDLARKIKRTLQKPPSAEPGGPLKDM